MKLDSIDRAIIAELSANARISNLALADKVHLTPGPCLRRVQRLEAEGIILGYSADIHPAVMNRGFEVTVDVTLSNFDRSTVDNFESSVAQHDEVLELHRLLVRQIILSASALLIWRRMSNFYPVTFKPCQELQRSHHVLL